jgi:serine/threonine protein kinase
VSDPAPQATLYTRDPIPSELWLEVIAATSKYESLLDNGQPPDLQAFVDRFPKIPKELLLDELRQLIEEHEESPNPPDQSPISLSSHGAPQPPTDRYSELDPIGTGGMGEVYRGLDHECSRPVAIKKLRKDHQFNPDARRRFLAEAELTAALEHPGIIPVYGKGVDPQGREFYAMRLIRGQGAGTLTDSIHALHHQLAQQKHRWLAEQIQQLRDLVRRVVSVCDTVAYAHNQGIVHRDLKPSNILIGPYGETLIADWGLARKIIPNALPQAHPNPDEAFPITEPIDNPIAATEGATSGLGTPGYWAPELAQSPPLHSLTSADIYSLGAILLCILTGKNPSPTGEPSANEWPHSTLSSLGAIGQKAMAKDLSQRYAKVEDLRLDLLHWIAGEPISAAPEGFWERAIRWPSRHRTAAAGLTGALGITLLAGATIVWLQAQQSRKLNAQAGQLAQALDYSNELLKQARESKEQAEKSQRLAESKEQEAIDSRTKAENRGSLAFNALLKFQELLTSNQEVFRSPELALLNDSLLGQSKEILTFILRDLEEESSPSPSDLDRLSEATHRLASMESNLQQHDNANALFDRTCEGLQRLLDAGDIPDDVQRIADLHIGKLRSLQGTISMRTGKNQQAKPQLEESIRKLTPLVDDDQLGKPELLVAANWLAGALSALSMFELMSGNLETAKGMQAQAIATLNDQTPDNYEYAMMHVQLHGNMSLIHEQSEEPEKALAELELAAKFADLAESMTTQKPGGVSLDSKIVRPTIQHLTVRSQLAHERARLLIAKQDPKGAIDVLSTLLQKEAQTLIRFPANVASIESYQMTASNLLTRLLNSGDQSSAIELTRNWEDLATTLLKRSTPDESVLLFLILAHHTSGHTLEQLGQREPALEKYQRALKECEQSESLKSKSAAICYQRVELEMHNFQLRLATAPWMEVELHIEGAIRAAEELLSLPVSNPRWIPLAKEQLSRGVSAMRSAAKEAEAARWDAELKALKWPSSQATP